VTDSRPAAAPALEARGLRKAFGGHVVLDGVDLAFGTGRLSALIGPNGAGKTTCFNLLTGFLAADGGEIRLKGEDVTRLPPYRRARLGICRSFQILNLFDDDTVLENQTGLVDPFASLTPPTNDTPRTAECPKGKTTTTYIADSVTTRTARSMPTTCSRRSRAEGRSKGATARRSSSARTASAVTNAGSRMN